MNIKRILLFVCILLLPFALQAKRRSQIVSRPSRLLAQNELKNIAPEITPADLNPGSMVTSAEDTLSPNTTQETPAAATQEEEEIDPEEVIRAEEEEEGAEEDQTQSTGQVPGADELDQTEQESLPEITSQGDETDDTRKDIYLNFENADLASFVNYIAELKNMNLIPDSKIAGNKISVTIREPLSVDGAWKVFLTIMDMSGFAMVKVGDIYKIVGKAGKTTEPLVSYINVEPDVLPDNDDTVRYGALLGTIQYKQIDQLLKSLLTGPIIEYPNANGFVVTDKCYTIKAAMKVVKELDRTDVQQQVSVLRLKQANATDVKTLFDSLMKRPADSPIARLLGRDKETGPEYFPPGTQILVEPRTNSLILLGNKKTIKKIEDFIINHVDTTLKELKSPIRVYELQNADVEIVKGLLETVTAPSDNPAAKYGGIRGGVKYFQKLTFKEDKTNNRLLVSCANDQDWELLKKILDDLDKPQPQVAIETLIVSVDFSDNKEIGGSIRPKKHNQIGRNVDAQAANYTNITFKDEPNGKTLLGDLLQNFALSGMGQTVLTFGKAGNIWAVFNLLQQQTNTTILSQPFIVTSNMKQTQIEIGETIRPITSQSFPTGGGGTAVNGYGEDKANTTVNVKPQMNLDGLINLELTVEQNEFIQSSGSTILGAKDKNTKKITTRVSVANGQVLVLGGFIKTSVKEETYKTPILGDIPVLGWFFKDKVREVQKTYTFIFMSPTIIKPRQSPGMNLYTRMKIDQVKTDIDNTIMVQKTNDPVHNWFFNPQGETYSHKVVDFANARYQPTTVDIKNDPYYRIESESEKESREKSTQKTSAEDLGPEVIDIDQPQEKPSGISEQPAPPVAQVTQPEETAPPPVEAQPPNKVPVVEPEKQKATFNDLLFSHPQDNKQTFEKFISPEDSSLKTTMNKKQ